MPFSRPIKQMFKTIPCTDSEGALQFVLLPPEKYLLIPTCYFPLPNFKSLSTNQLLSPFQAQQQFLKAAIKSGNLLQVFLKVNKKNIYFIYVCFSPSKHFSKYICLQIPYLLSLQSVSARPPPPPLI